MKSVLGKYFSLMHEKGISDLLYPLWTDHNLHDPGITILEHLAYAISDLSYRLGFGIEDLLIEQGEQELLPFFTARRILPNAPLTINDYRKILIDIEGVKNAWLEALKEPVPGMQYASETGELSFVEDDSETKQIHFKGLYRVQIEPEAGVKKEEIEQQVQLLLHQGRNLCEDFFSITILDSESIGIKLAMELEENADPEGIWKDMQDLIAHWVSPSLRFYSLEEMLDKGKTPDEIFEGPVLNHGFINEDKLNKFDKRIALRGSDLLHLIMDLQEVKFVREILMWSGDGQKEKQYLQLNPELAPCLKTLELIFFKNAKEIGTKSIMISASRSSALAEKKEDLPIPEGKYRHPGKYFSITNDFPQNYGIGPGGLPKQATEKRQAQAKQLKAYLAFFEQLLANYFAQLDHFKELFALNWDEDQSYPTYFTQTLEGKEGIPGYEMLLKNPDSHLENLQAAIETEVVSKNRKSRRLDHLLARFAEHYSDFPFLTGKNPAEVDRQKFIDQKRKFLLAYPEISSTRGQAFDYKDPEKVYHPENISGLEKRIRLLLGMEEEIKVPVGLEVEFYEELDTDNIVEYRFRVKEKDTGKIVLSSSTHYPEDMIFARKELIWTLRQAAKPEGYQRDETIDNRYYFNITYPDGEVVARRIEYFKTKREREAAIIKLRSLCRGVPEQEYFYLIEHLVLKPMDKPNNLEPVFPSIWYPFLRTITRFEEIFPPPNAQFLNRRIKCYTPSRRLQPGDRIRIFNSDAYDGYRDVKEVTDEGFIIYLPKGIGTEQQLVEIKPEESPIIIPKQQDQLPPVWTKLSKEHHDPWSFQLSLVFPGWIGRFQNPDFRSFIEDSIYAETPSHITPYFHWIGNGVTMNAFEAKYFGLRNKLAHDRDAIKEKDWLNEFLNIAKRSENNAPLHALLIGSRGSVWLSPAAIPVESRQIALSFWAKIDQIGKDQEFSIVATTQNPGNTPIRISFSESIVRFTWGTNNDRRDWDFIVLDNDEFPQSLFEGWIHWTFVKDLDEGIMQIYWNGKLVKEEGGKNYSLFGSFNQFYLSMEKIPEPLFSGSFTDIRLWSTNDWIVDIDKIIHYRLSGSESGLHAYWKLNEGDGTALNDSTDNHFDGEHYNCTWT